MDDMTPYYGLWYPAQIITGDGKAMDALDYFRFNNMQPKDNTDMQSATRTAMKNVATRDMEQALEAQNERNRQHAIAIVNYWMYQGTDEERLVASYVKQLEDKIKALEGLPSDE